jgi:hypothetical protein
VTSSWLQSCACVLKIQQKPVTLHTDDEASVPLFRITPLDVNVEVINECSEIKIIIAWITTATQLFFEGT